jgi:hypothetical protein
VFGVAEDRLDCLFSVKLAAAFGCKDAAHVRVKAGVPSGPGGVVIARRGDAGDAQLAVGVGGVVTPRCSTGARWRDSAPTSHRLVRRSPTQKRCCAPFQRRIVRQYGLTIRPVSGVEGAGSPMSFVGGCSAVRL